MQTAAKVLIRVKRVQTAKGAAECVAKSAGYCKGFCRECRLLGRLQSIVRNFIDENNKTIQSYRTLRAVSWPISSKIVPPKAVLAMVLCKDTRVRRSRK